MKTTELPYYSITFILMASLTINILAIWSMHVRLVRCAELHYGTLGAGGGGGGRYKI